MASQAKAAAARKTGRFRDEIVPVTVTERKGVKTVSDDEYIREGATYESLSGLRPAFQKDGTVTAGNASGETLRSKAKVCSTESYSTEWRRQERESSRTGSR